MKTRKERLPPPKIPATNGTLLANPSLPQFPAPGVDGRTVALRVLGRYVTNLRFNRPGAKGTKEVIPFRISPDSFVIEWPDYEVEYALPSVIVMADNEAERQGIGLSTSVFEETSSLCLGPNVALVRHHEHIETIRLELHASKKAERRALLAGLEIAFDPIEEMSGLRLRMDEFYGETVCFSLLSSRILDDEDSPKNRRTAALNVEMRFNVVHPVQSNELVPSVEVIVLEEELC